ncbi:O-antigen ligase family protein [Methylobacterium sp. 77]|uniref:O-antigen ligase family protein n=1 Tax=Methylobacterium sp. 77 TaxID=1101192 RepID=UPI00035ECD9B|nr:O-antigen ligase family protein [Methylobacterium sp. 77]
MTPSRASGLLGSIALPLAFTAAWAAYLATAGNHGTIAYLAPLLVAGGFAVALILWGLMAARPMALLIMLAIVVLGLNIAFAPRAEGEVGLTPQNGVKLVVWLVLAVVAILHGRRIAEMFRDPVLAFAGAHVAVALLSTLWSLTPVYTMVNGLGLLGYLGFACLLAATVPDRTAIRVMTGSLFGLMVGGFVIGTLFPEIGWLPPSNEEPQWRFQGISGHPNVCAQQAGYFLTLAVCARRRSQIGRGMALVCIVTACSAIWMTNSRTTLLACLLAWGVIGLRGRGLLMLAAIPVCLAGSFAALFLAVADLSHFDALLGGVTRSGSISELTTLTGRTEIWSVAADLIAQRPLFGWGYNGTEQLISDSVPTTFYGSHLNAHNMSVQLVLTLGFIGAIPGFCFVAGLLLRMITTPDPTRDQVTIFMVVSGLSEAPIFILPALQNLIVFYVIARDAQWLLPRIGKSPPPAEPSSAE